MIQFKPRMKVCTLRGELDEDARGRERLTPPGTWGHLDHKMHDASWAVYFPNGAAVSLEEGELRDPDQYVVMQ